MHSLSATTNNIMDVNFPLCFTEILGFGPSKVVVKL